MKKTAAEVAEYLIKVAFGIGALRSVSNKMFQSGQMVRAAAGYGGAVARRAGNMSLGPAVAGKLAPGSYSRVQSSLQSSRGVPWPAVTGGKGFNTSKELPGYGVLSPENKEVTNRISHLHEGLERKTMLQDVNRKGTMGVYDNEKRWGGVGGAHHDPQVLLGESNMVRGLDPKYQGTKDFFSNMRKSDPSAQLLEKQYPGFQYGQTRLSRHAIKRMREGMLTPQKTAQYMVRDVMRDLYGKRKLDPNYLNGEMDEFHEAYRNKDAPGLDEEMQDVIYALHLLKHQATRKNFPIVGADDKLREFYRRKDFLNQSFQERNVPFHTDYMAEGSNPLKPHKIQRAFELAGHTLSPEDAAALSNRYRTM